MKINKLVMTLAAAGLMIPNMAAATNGYFSHGYGIKAKGMGGAGIAYAQDAMAAATNPAGMANIGNRIDFGLDWFNPNRKATWTAQNGVFTDMATGDYKSGNNNFLVPEFGYNHMYNDTTSLGIVAYGNGGMNTDYGRIAITGGTSNTYSNLEQLFIAPTVAMKLSPAHAVGVSLNLVYQTFEARGLQGFTSHSDSPNEVTDKGKDASTGAGIKLGWAGQVSPNVTLGATYQSKTRMSKVDKYKGLMAEQGRFDVPETYGIGIAVKADPNVTLAADIVQINYSDIKSLANPGTQFPAIAGTLLGTDNGSGFGWKDQTVYKLGVVYAYSQSLTLRAGYNYGKMPLTENNTLFNILAPATVEQHLTFGATWTMANKAELSVSYMHAFSKGINGPINGVGGAGGGAVGYPVNLEMDQNSLGIAYGWKM